MDNLQDVDTTTIPPVDGQALIFDAGIWKPTNLQNPSTTLGALTDVQLGSLTNGELLTYNSTANKWVNQVKPEYTIEEMKDFDNTVAKLDNDFLSYNLSAAKWEPKTFEQEIPNYLALRQ